jgi:hypothetical protein
VTDTPHTTEKPRRNFLLYFMGLMLLATAATFICFTHVARISKAERSEASRKNLLAFHQALKSFSEAPQNTGQFPEDLKALYPQYLKNADVFFHPAWPDRDGYVYVYGVKPRGANADSADTILVFENIPPGKEKLGRLILFLSGEVHMWAEAEFQSRISAQESVWKSQGRSWLALPAAPPTQVK